MAKRVSGSARRAPKTAVPTISTRGMNYKKVLRKIKASSVTVPLISGVSAYFIGKFAIRFYKSHPEISDFLKENFDTVEGKLREYKNSIMSEETEARH